MIKHLGLKAYGKINLGLDVLGRRENGYHDVRMIMQTVGIFDRIDLLHKSSPGIQVETNLHYLPTNENNLVYKAARLLMDEFHIPDGVIIRLRKFIPVAAGMAGGSSDAAAVLFGINKMFRLGLDTRGLMERGGCTLLCPAGNRAVRGHRRDPHPPASGAPVPGSHRQTSHQRLHPLGL